MKNFASTGPSNAKMKGVFFIATLLLGSYAQSQPSNIVSHSFGYSLISDYFRTPPRKTISNGVAYYRYSTGFSTSTFVYRLRCKLFSPAEKVSMSLSANPTAAFSVALSGNYPNTGIGYLNLPLFFNFEFGVGSNLDAKSDVGGVVGFGGEYYYNPLFIIKEKEDYPITRSWIQPVFYLSVRYRNGLTGWSESLKEVFLKGGFTGSKETSISGSSMRGFNVMLGFLIVFNQYKEED